MTTGLMTLDARGLQYSSGPHEDAIPMAATGEQLPVVIPAHGPGLTTLGSNMPGVPAGQIPRLSGLGQSSETGSSDLPPIVYIIDPSANGKKGDWPDFSRGALQRVQQRVLEGMTVARAEYILSEEGADELRQRLYRKARETADYDSGLFEDGSGRLDDVAARWRDEAFRQYEAAAVKFLEGDASLSGTEAATFGGNWLNWILGIGGLTGAGYAIYSFTR